MRTLGLVLDDTPGRAPPPSKNRVLLGRAADGTCVLVKAAVAPGPSGIVREGQVLAALGLRTGTRGCPLGLPAVHAFDPERGLLALHWLDGAETLHAYQQRTGRLGVRLARQIGRALGWLHREGRYDLGLDPDPPHVPHDTDFAQLFTYLRPEVYARLSHAGIALIGAIQRHKEAATALAGLARDAREPGDRRLLHGDVKPANIMRLPGRRPGLVFVDWERSVPGDPARDLGALLAEYVLLWLAPEPGARPVSQAALRSFASAMLAAYRTERGPADPPGGDLENRVMRWTGLGVLVYVYGLTHYSGEFDARSRHVASYAADMLGRPERWVSEILRPEASP